MRVWILAAALWLAAIPLAGADTLYRPKITQIWSLSGFQEPESVVLEGRENVLYVSNMNGDASAKDGNGYISKISTDGRILSKAWVAGLNAPKGLAVVFRKLFVADIDELVEITFSNQEKKIYKAPGAQFLNDVTDDAGGRIYVSDTYTNAIYRATGGKFELWLRDPKLNGPNGLAAGSKRLIVASWGAGDAPGSLLTVSLDKKEIAPLGDGRPVGKLDGVAPDGHGNFLVTDWVAGDLLLVSPSGESIRVMHLGDGSADFFYLIKDAVLIVPIMKEGRVDAYAVDFE